MEILLFTRFAEKNYHSLIEKWMMQVFTNEPLILYSYRMIVNKRFVTGKVYWNIKSGDEIIKLAFKAEPVGDNLTRLTSVEPVGIKLEQEDFK